MNPVARAATAGAVNGSATSAAVGSSVRVRPHRPFALVLSGGGARGLAHAGVLRALEHYGYAPSAIVGVSMGAVVGATYALNPDWYQALKTINTTGFPQPTTRHSSDLRERTRVAVALQRALSGMVLGWGAGVPALAVGQALLDQLTLKRNLEDGHIPIVATATDLVSGTRVVMRSGNAARVRIAWGVLTALLELLMSATIRVGSPSAAGSANSLKFRAPN